MSTRGTRSGAAKPKAQERRWLLITNGSVHGIEHSELTLVRKIPAQQTVRSTVSVFTISKPLAFVAGLAVLALLLLLIGCQLPPAQKGGQTRTEISRPGHTNLASLTQSDNPSTSSHQSVQSEQTVEYGSLGTRLEQEAAEFAEKSFWPRSKDGAMPMRIITKDRTDTTIGAAQKDSVREWTGKAHNLQPVMWVGIAMMSVVAGVLIYFGWWTKGVVAAVVGVAMIVLAQTLPNHEPMILLGGLGVFGLVALLVLYAYYKGQLDRNHNGIPDILERNQAPARS